MKITRFLSLILTTMLIFSSAFGTSEVMASAKGVKRGDFTVYGSANGSSFKNNVLTISGNGEYTIVGNGTYTDDRIVITSSKMPKINLKNIRIRSGANLPAIEIKGRKGADLILKGMNHADSLNSSAVRYTGNEEIIISGNGSLKADTGKAGQYGIYCMSGKLIIKSGTVFGNARIKAKEVKISGGVVNSELGDSVIRNSQNKRVYKQTITIPEAVNKTVSKIKIRTAKGKNYNYSYKGMRTDENSRMNVFLPENTAVISANVGNTLYSLENTAKAANLVKNNSEIQNMEASVNVLEGTTAPITDRLADSTSFYSRVSAVNSFAERAYTLLDDRTLDELSAPLSTSGLGTRGTGTPDLVVNIGIDTSGSESSAKSASIKVNGKAEVMVIEKGPANQDLILEEFKRRFAEFTTETITVPDSGSPPQTILKYSDASFTYKWENGDPSIVNLQLADGSKTMAVGKKPGKTLLRCDVSATYTEKEYVKELVPGTTTGETRYVLKQTLKSKPNFASVYLTLFVMPDLVSVKLEPTNANIIVGGSAGESTAFLNAKIEGMTDSDPNEQTDVTINNVQYVWREVLPKEFPAGEGDFLDIMYDTKNIDKKDNPGAYPDETLSINGQDINTQDGLPYAHSVNVVAKKEGKNIKIGLTAYLKYTYKSKTYKPDGSEGDPVDVVVETKLPEVFTVINIEDKGGIVLDKQSLNLSINGKNSKPVDTLTAKMLGADTKLVYFKWWEYSGPSKASLIDFSNKRGILAEPDKDDLKTLPIADDDPVINAENKEKMKGSDGATITVQALEAGTTYLYVEAVYTNPDTNTTYTKETMVTVTIKDETPNDSGSGSGSGTGSGSGSGTGSGTGTGDGQQNGNGDLIVSELPSAIYDTKSHTPMFHVKSGINVLRPGVDYDFSFIDNVNVGTATLMINGKNQYDGFWAKKTFTISKANLVIKNPVLQINTLRESNYTFDLSKLLPATGMSAMDRQNTVYKIGNTTLPKTNFTNITNGGNLGFLSFNARGITTAGTQGIIDLSIESNPNFNPATVQLTVMSDDGLKVTFHPENGKDSYTIAAQVGSKLNLPMTPQKENYTFIGWYTNTGKQWNFDTDIVTSGLELYAKWRDYATVANTDSVSYSTNDGRITQDSIDRAVAEHRDLKVNVLDERGDIVSQWNFDADYLGGKLAGQFDLSTDIYNAEESPAFNLLKEDDNDDKGMGISFRSDGRFPVGSMVRVKALPNYGARKGRSLYLYKYDPDTHKLHTLPRIPKVKVDNEGYAQIPVVESGDYVLATKRPSSKNIRTLIQQVKVNKITTAKVGSKKRIKLYAPPTLKKLANLKKNLPDFWGGYTVNFKSSDTKIASVSKNGNIKFKKKGKVKIFIDIKLYHGISKRITQTITVK